MSKNGKRMKLAVVLPLSILVILLAVGGVFAFSHLRREPDASASPEIDSSAEPSAAETVTVKATFSLPDGSTGESAPLTVLKKRLDTALESWSVTPEGEAGEYVLEFIWANADGDPAEFLAWLGQPGRLEMRRGSDTDATGAPTGELVLDNRHIQAVEFQLTVDDAGGAPWPTVFFTLTEEGRAIFARVTDALKGTGRISVWVDGQMLFDPLVQEQITQGEVVLSGLEDEQTAKELVNLLNSGFLPQRVAFYETQTVSSTKR